MTSANKEDMKSKNNYHNNPIQSDFDNDIYYENFLLQSKIYFGINFIQGLKYEFNDPEISKADELREELMIKIQKVYELSQDYENYVNDLPTFEQLMECYSTIGS